MSSKIVEIERCACLLAPRVGKVKALHQVPDQLSGASGTPFTLTVCTLNPLGLIRVGTVPPFAVPLFTVPLLGHRQRHHRQARLDLAETAQLGVGAEDHATHMVGSVGGDQIDRLRTITFEKPGQGLPEGKHAQALGEALLEDPKAGLDPGLERMDAQKTRTEGVKGGHVGILGIAREVALAEVQKTGPDALAQLAGGPLGERDREDPTRCCPVLAHCPHEALDQD